MGVRHLSIVAFGSWLGLVGCTGQIGSAQTDKAPAEIGENPTANPADPAPKDLTVGIGIVRHLTRTEYDNTVHDLFGTTLTPADEFQPDLGASGFDKDSVSQTITPAHTQAFEAGSFQAVDAVFPRVWLKARRVPCCLAGGQTTLWFPHPALFPYD